MNRNKEEDIASLQQETLAKKKGRTRKVRPLGVLGAAAYRRSPINLSSIRNRL